MDSDDKKEHLGEAERDQFKEILAYIEKTDLEYVEIEKDGRKICLKRSGSAIPEKKSAASAQAAEPLEPEPPKYFSIRSPIVGRFHSSMGSDRPALVVEGGHITAGQRVAIVEAMKIKKDVLSAVSGTVRKIHLRDGDPVEYGQELFSIEPNEPGGDE